MAGRSFVSVLKEQPVADDRKLFWEYTKNYAMRHGNWKLVQSNLDGEWALFDMAADRGETVNLASRHAQVLQRMQDEWAAWHDAVYRQGVVLDGELPAD